MNSQEYRAVLSRIGLGAHELGQRLGVSWRTTERWRLDDTLVPEPTARLITVIETLGVAAYDAIMKRHARRYSPPPPKRKPG